MLKRLSAALAAVFVLATQSFAAGTIPFSLSQQLDNLGKPLAGCQLYTIVAGTTSTPQNAFQDSALTIPLPNPQTCNAAGRLPQFFLADGSIKVRLTDLNGVTVIVADGILVIGPSGGGGGGSTVDPTTILTTGDIKATYGTGVIAGFVRLNGRTIGAATSGATERANTDAQALFVYLWNTDVSLVVSTGRGVSAAADWSANKTITLPDWRGRALAALDDMGNTAAGRLTSAATGFGTSAIVLGAVGGNESFTLAQAQLPIVNFVVSGSAPGVTNNVDVVRGVASSVTGVGIVASIASAIFGQLATTTTLTGSGVVASSGGSGTAFRTVPPMKLTTIYIKL
jgi:hypothetical protein